MLDDRAGFSQYALQTNKLLAAFQSLLYSVAMALGMTRPQHPATVSIDVMRLVPDMFNADVIVAGELPTFSYAPYMTIVVPVRKRGSSSTITRSPINVI